MSIFTDDFLLRIVSMICINNDVDPNIITCVGLLDRVFRIVFQTYPDFMGTTMHSLV